MNASRSPRDWMVGILAALAFLAPLKFGTPVVLQDQVIPPSGGWQWLFFSWPNQVLVLGVFVGLGWWVLDRRRRACRVDVLLVLPLLVLAAQLPALGGSINPQVSAATVLHLAACVLVFYVAAWYVRDGAGAVRLFEGMGLAMFLVVVFALEQALGGLEATRQYAAEHVDLAAAPPELRLRLTSNRVFSTLVYPNSLAGFMVVAFAPTLVWVGWRGRTWDPRVRRVSLVLIGSLMVGCLLLSGSRGGFLAFGAAVLVGGWCGFGPRSGRARWALPAVAAALVAVFGAGHWFGFFHLRSSSLAARVDYWLGAVAIIRDHPWFGTGPGTFGSIYPMYKTALTEEAQLAHNGYLQMWSDAGLAAFLVFAALWAVALREAWRLARDRRGDPAALAILTALVGWGVHGVVDFDLHVPGVALLAFMLAGALQGLKQPAWEEAGRPIVPTGLLRRGAVALVVLLTAAVVWVEGRGLVAAKAQGESVRRLDRDVWGALAAAYRAIHWAPLSSGYRLAAGDLEMAAGRPDRAAARYGEAIGLNPYHAGGHFRLGMAWSEAGVDHRKVLKQLRLAVKLNPTSERYRAGLMGYEESVRHPEGGLIESVPAPTR